MNDGGPIILFDGVCNLCNGAVQFVIRHDKKKKFRFAFQQSDAGMQLLKDYRLADEFFNSFVLIQNKKAYVRSTGALKVFKQLDGPSKLLYGFMIVPRFIRDAVYRFISQRRYKWFGKRNECMIPTPELRERFI